MAWDPEVDFDLTVDETPDRTVITVVGEIDVATTPTLQAALVDATARDLPIVLDTAGVVFMDSTGLAGILAMRDDGGSSGRFVLQRPSAAVRRILDLTGITGIFEIED